MPRDGSEILKLTRRWHQIGKKVGVGITTAVGRYLVVQGKLGASGLHNCESYFSENCWNFIGGRVARHQTFNRHFARIGLNLEGYPNRIPVWLNPKNMSCDLLEVKKASHCQLNYIKGLKSLCFIKPVTRLGSSLVANPRIKHSPHRHSA